MGCFRVWPSRRSAPLWLGFDKVPPLKLALKNLVKEGKIELDSGSYLLGAEERSAGGVAYEEAFECARHARGEKPTAKEQGKARAAERVAQALKVAYYASNVAQDRKALGIGQAAGF